MKISLNKRLIEKVTKDFSKKEEIKEFRNKNINKLDKMYKNNIFKSLNLKIIKQNKVFYSIFIGMILLATINIYINYKMMNNIEREKFLVLNSKKNTTVKTSTNIDFKEELNESNNLDTRKEYKNTSRSNNSNNNVIKIKKIEEKILKEKKLEFIKPISGKIIKNYSNKELVYSKTLETWKTHEGIDIFCNVNDKIKSCEDGIVEKIYEDSLFGNTIIILHEKGYKTVYSNVISNLKIKDKVTKNQTIGKVDNSGIVESKDESHIHFMMIYNDKIIDPNNMIKF